MRLIQGSGMRRAMAGLVVFGLVFLSASAALADLCPRVKFVQLGDKSLAIGWTMGIDERDIDDVYGVEFGGYRVWVKEVWNSEEFYLEREYVWGEEDTEAAGYWDLEPFYEDSIRVYTDRHAQNAFPYMLSVTGHLRRASARSTIHVLSTTANLQGLYIREPASRMFSRRFRPSRILIARAQPGSTGENAGSHLSGFPKQLRSASTLYQPSWLRRSIMTIRMAITIRRTGISRTPMTRTWRLGSISGQLRRRDWGASRARSW